MSDRATRIVLWSARGLHIAFAAFLSLFAMDVFGEGSILKVIGALFLHLLPTCLLLVALGAAWRRPWIGSLAMLAFAALWVWLIRNRNFVFQIYLTICGPLFLTAGLYFIAWRSQAGARLRAAALQ